MPTIRKSYAKNTSRHGNINDPAANLVMPNRCRVALIAILIDAIIISALKFTIW